MFDVAILRTIKKLSQISCIFASVDARVLLRPDNGLVVIWRICVLSKNEVVENENPSCFELI